MDRKEFLSLLGLGSASLLATACLGGCSKSANSPSSGTNIDFTLNLSDAANAALATNGGYVYSNGVIVARTNAGNYIAVSKSCTHEGTQVVYQATNQRFFCGNHGATFSEAGTVTNGPATKALTQYKTALSGNSLRIYS